MIQLLSLLITGISSIFIFAGIGFVLLRIFNSKYKVSIISDLWFFILVGLLISVSSYAIITTKGNTILLPVLFLTLYLVWKYEAFSFKSNLNLRSLSVFVLLSFLINFGFHYYTSIIHTFYLEGDFIFYGRLAHFISSNGIETTDLEYLLKDNLTKMPYHYGDIWLTSLISNLSHINPISVSLVVLPSILETLLGILFLQYFYTTEYRLHTFFIALFIAFLSSIFALIPFELIHSNNFIIHLNIYQKLDIVSIIFLVCYILVQNKKIDYLYFFASILGLLYLPIMPAIALTLGLFFLYYKFVKKEYIKSFYLFILVVLYCLFFYINLNASPKEHSNLFALITKKGFLPFLILVIKIFIVCILQFVYLFLFIFPDYRSFLNELKNQIFLIIIAICGILCYALLNLSNENSVQLFSNPFIALLPISIAVFLLTFLRFNKKWFLVLFIMSMVPSFIFLYKIKRETNQCNEDLKTLNSFLKKSEKTNIIYSKNPSSFNTIFLWSTKVFPPLSSIYKERMDINFISLDIIDLKTQNYMEETLQKSSTLYYYKKQDSLKNFKQNFIKKYSIEYYAREHSAPFPNDLELNIIDSVQLNCSSWTIYQLKKD